MINRFPIAETPIESMVPAQLTAAPDAEPESFDSQKIRGSKGLSSLQQKRYSKQMILQQSQAVDSETRKTLDMLQQINREASNERLGRLEERSQMSNPIASQESIKKQ